MMARYFLLEPAFLKAKGDPGPRRHDQHTIVEFDGRPGKMMAALDSEAKRRKGGWVSLEEKRARAKLATPHARLLAAAEAEMAKAESQNARSEEGL
jgi:hypothetical protein